MQAFEWEKPVLELETRIDELKQFVHSTDMDFSEEIKTLERKASKLRKEIYANLTPFQRVTMARHPKRPTTLDYISFSLMTSWSSMETEATEMIGQS